MAMALKKSRLHSQAARAEAASALALEMCILTAAFQFLQFAQNNDGAR